MVKNKSLVLIALLLLLSNCSRDQKIDVKKETEKVPETFDIQDKIKSILENANLHESIYNNTERVSVIEASKDNGLQVQEVFQLAKELLNKGDTEKAIAHIEKLVSYKPYNTISEETYLIHKFRGICFLRLAEQQNCQEYHTGESCIVPIGKSGVHKIKQPSTNAILIYEQLLRFKPNDFESRWLLNVAYMSLGQYPQSVPKEHLIKINATNSSKQLKNIGTDIGVDFFDLSGGVIADDFNNDGYIDLLHSSWSQKGKIYYLENNKNNGFQDLTEKAGLNELKGGLNLKQADFNNDGFLDFIILRGAWIPVTKWGILPNSLIKNNGDGTFTDVTISSGIYSENPTQSAEWFDFNNDGWLDLIIANETTPSSDKQFSCELFRNDEGRFTNVSEIINGNLVGYFKGVNVADVNNDGYSDFFLSNLNGSNALFLNKNGESFDDVSKESNVTNPNSAFPCWFFDFNNDGFEDLYVATYDRLAFDDQSGQFARDRLSLPIETEKNILYKNNGKGEFIDVTSEYFKEASLSTMGCNYGDIDNDGYKDFYLGTGSPDYRSIVPNRFYYNQQGAAFSERTFELGLGHIQKGHAIAFSDFDNDGDQDIYAVMGGAFEGDKFPNAFFENPGNLNNYIKIKLIGTQSNRSAIGARIRIGLSNGETIYHTVNSGASFGANPLMAHIGIGKNEISSVEVKWPNGKNEWINLTGFEKNSCFQLKEGMRLSKFELNKLEFKAKESSHDHHHHH